MIWKVAKYTVHKTDKDSPVCDARSDYTTNKKKSNSDMLKKDKSLWAQLVNFKGLHSDTVYSKLYY